jgi:Cd2+/Zn2+-exporting ATPase
LTSVIVSFGQGVAGIISLTDAIKPDNITAIKQLQALNIELIMLTGDSEKAHYVANTVYQKVYGGLLPENRIK